MENLARYIKSDFLSHLSHYGLSAVALFHHQTGQPHGDGRKKGNDQEINDEHREKRQYPS